jgi:uncharacterized membrane protein
MAKRRSRMSSAERRKQEMELRKEKNIQTAKLLVAIVLVVAIIAVAYWTFGGDVPGPAASEELTVNANGQLEIPVSEVSRDARYYSYDVHGVEVRFFAVIGSDGNIRVAFDACDVCYEDKQGYRQDGTDMVCNNCGNAYATDGIGTKNLEGGCWPSYLANEVEDGKILINASDLRAKRYMFD